MANEEGSIIPAALEQLIGGLGELATALGETARPAIAAVQVRLGEAIAARDRGDPPAAMRAIGEAMETLAALADRLDPHEAALMRAVSSHFRSALLRGDVPEAKQRLDVMFERSGARERKKAPGD
jgi:hypothetical protein